MKVRAIQFGNNSNETQYLVMAAHAGRSDRTGAEVHMATLTVYKGSGRAVLNACNCSGNGALRGSLVAGDDDKGFARVSCKSCGASDELATARNAKSTIIDIEGTR